MEEVVFELSNKISNYSFSKFTQYLQENKEGFNVEGNRYAELLLLLASTLKYANEVDSTIYNFTKEYLYYFFVYNYKETRELVEKGIIKLGYVYDEGKPLDFDYRSKPRNLYYELFEVRVFNTVFHIPVPIAITEPNIRGSILSMIIDELGLPKLFNDSLLTWDDILSLDKDDMRVIEFVKLMEMMKFLLPSRSREETFGDYFKPEKICNCDKDRLITDILLIIKVLMDRYYDIIEWYATPDMYSTITNLATFLDRPGTRFEEVYIGRYVPVYDFIVKPFFL